MKINFLIALMFSFSLFSQNKTASDSASSGGVSSDASEEGGSPRTPVSTPRALEEHFNLLEVTPGSAADRLHTTDDGLRPIQPWRQHTRLTRAGNPNLAVYVITVGQADLTALPIFDLRNAFIGQADIDALVREIAAIINRQNFFRYVGRTTQGVLQRATGHVQATPLHPERRLPQAILRAQEQRQHVRMHTLVQGIHPDQMANMEAELIRALNANGPLGLNGNAGTLTHRERGARLALEVTPNTRAPQTAHGRGILTRDLRPVDANYAIPETWVNIVYMITPIMEIFRLPIVDLEGEELDVAGLQRLRDRFAAYTHELPQRYIGLATEGMHRDRTALVRAREHEYAGIAHPFRRLPLAFAGMPAQMHVLVAHIHPDQIRDIEALLIQAFQAVGLLGLNANTGHRAPQTEIADPTRRILLPAMPLGSAVL